MKKLMIAMAVAAGAAGAVLAAERTDWFEASFDGSSPSTGGEWLTTGAGVTAPTFSENALTLDSIPDSAPVTFQATEEKCAVSTNLYVDLTAVFEAYDELPELLSGAKAGVTAQADTNFFVVGAVDSASAWVDSGIAAVCDSVVPVTVAFTVENDVPYATYTFGNGGELGTKKVQVVSTAIQTVKLVGNGSVSRLSSQYEQLGISWTTPESQSISVDPVWAENNAITPEAFVSKIPNETTGLTAYESYMLGLNVGVPLKSTVGGTPGGSSVTVAAVSTPRSADLVSYQLKKKVDGVWTDVDGKVGATPSFTIDGDDKSGIYAVEAKIEDGNSAQMKQSVNAVGVMKVGSTDAETLVAVAWLAADGTENVHPADLIDGSSLETGDSVQVYIAETGAWEAWTWNGAAWMPPSEPTITALPRGAVVKVIRKTPTSALYTVGGYTSAAAPAVPLVQGKWNLVAKPGLGAYELGAAVLGTSTKDVVYRSNSTESPDSFTYSSTDGWKKNTTGRSGKRVTYGRSSEGCTIPQGVGFYFLDKSGKSTIQWPAY